MMLDEDGAERGDARDPWPGAARFPRRGAAAAMPTKSAPTTASAVTWALGSRKRPVTRSPRCRT